MAKELEEFFKGLPKEDKSQADIFGDKKPTGEVENKGDESGEDNEPKKNRHGRRWEAKYQAERESNIALAAKLQVLTETQKFQKEVGSDVDDEGLKHWLRIYGDKPEHREAYEVLTKNVLAPITSKAEKLEKELEEIKNRDVVANQQVKEFEGFIEKQFEKIEDEYDVDITSGSKDAEKTRNEFIDLIKQLSPKDEEGNITSYADFQGTWELYQANKPKVDNGSQKRNEIASRSMANSGGNGANVPKQRTPGFFGWKKDLNIS